MVVVVVTVAFYLLLLLGVVRAHSSSVVPLLYVLLRISERGVSKCPCQIFMILHTSYFIIILLSPPPILLPHPHPRTPDLLHSFLRGTSMCIVLFLHKRPSSTAGGSTQQDTQCGGKKLFYSSWTPKLYKTRNY